MNEHDPLELELARFLPSPPSAAVRQRIADELASQPLVPANSQAGAIWQACAVGGLLAASILSIALWQVQRSVPQPTVAVAKADPSVAQVFDDTLPSAWKYSRALRESPDAVNTLLDSQPHRQHVPRSPLFANARFNSELPAF